MAKRGRLRVRVRTEVHDLSCHLRCVCVFVCARACGEHLTGSEYENIIMFN